MRRVDEQQRDGGRRDELLTTLVEDGIEARIYFPLAHRQPGDRRDGDRREGATQSRTLKVDQATVDRLLDLRHASRLEQLEAAFRVLGDWYAAQPPY